MSAQDWRQMHGRWFGAGDGKLYVNDDTDPNPFNRPQTAINTICAWI